MSFETAAKQMHEKLVSPDDGRDHLRERDVLRAIESNAYDRNTVLAHPCPFYILAALQKAGFGVEYNDALRGYCISW